MFNYHTRNARAMCARRKAEIDEEFHVYRKLEKIIYFCSYDDRGFTGFASIFPGFIFLSVLVTLTAALRVYSTQRS
jgi:hypothetical protein